MFSFLDFFFKEVLHNDFLVWIKTLMFWFSALSSEVKLTVASFLSDRIVDETLDALSLCHHQLVSIRKVVSHPRYPEVWYDWIATVLIYTVVTSVIL